MAQLKYHIITILFTIKTRKIDERMKSIQIKANYTINNIIVLLKTFPEHNEQLDHFDQNIQILHLKSSKQWPENQYVVNEEEIAMSKDLVKQLKADIPTSYNSKEYSTLMNRVLNDIEKKLDEAEKTSEKNPEKKNLKLNPKIVNEIESLINQAIDEKYKNILSSKINSISTSSKKDENIADNATKQLNMYKDIVDELSKNKALDAKGAKNLDEVKKLNEEIMELIDKYRKSGNPEDKKILEQKLKRLDAQVRDKLNEVAVVESKDTINNLRNELEKIYRADKQSLQKNIDEKTMETLYKQLQDIENKKNVLQMLNQKAIEQKQLGLNNLNLELINLNDSIKDFLSVEEINDQSETSKALSDKFKSVYIANTTSAIKQLESIKDEIEHLDATSTIEIPEEVEDLKEDEDEAAANAMNLEKLKNAKNLDKDTFVSKLPEKGDIVDTARELHSRATLYDSSDNKILTICKSIIAHLVKFQFMVEDKDKMGLVDLCYQLKSITDDLKVCVDDFLSQIPVTNSLVKNLKSFKDVPGNFVEQARILVQIRAYQLFKGFESANDGEVKEHDKNSEDSWYSLIIVCGNFTDSVQKVLDAAIACSLHSSYKSNKYKFVRKTMK
ncbi:MAG: hypothetical protein MHPSP_000057 [Paramarteilia canceri]